MNPVVAASLVAQKVFLNTQRGELNIAGESAVHCDGCKGYISARSIAPLYAATTSTKAIAVAAYLRSGQLNRVLRSKSKDSSIKLEPPSQFSR